MFNRKHFFVTCVSTLILVIGSYFYIRTGVATNNTMDIIHLFPIENYTQKFSTWLDLKQTDTESLLDKRQRQRHWEALMRHYYQESSPWNKNFIIQILKRPNPYDAEALNLYETNVRHLTKNSNTPQTPEDQIKYGANFRAYTENWFETIKQNMQLHQFETPLNYDTAKRAIATDNLQGRILPTDEPHFYHHTIPGQGYPFDTLQASTIWAGTPLYILGETKDKAWVFIRSPRFTAWVKSTAVALVDESFITQWLASKKFLGITGTQVSITDYLKGTFHFLGYVGMMLPQVKLNNQSDEGLYALIPVRDTVGKATIATAKLSTTEATPLPLLPSIHHFKQIIEGVLGHPYGWGGMYFYNDCASELKNIFTLFGIWLPIGSKNQVDERQLLGTMQDLSEDTEAKSRLETLTKVGKPFMTLIYLPGHIMLYIGNHQHISGLIPMSYQSLWGFRPKPERENVKDRRSIVGQNVLLPLLVHYPEDPSLWSLAGRNTFKLFHLDQLPAENA